MFCVVGLVQFFSMTLEGIYLTGRENPPASTPSSSAAPTLLTSASHNQERLLEHTQAFLFWYQITMNLYNSYCYVATLPIGSFFAPSMICGSCELTGYPGLARDNGPSARRQRNPGTRCKPCTQLSTNDVFGDSLPKKNTCTRTALVSFGVQTKTSYASNRMQLGGLYSLYTSKARLWKSLKFYLYYSTQFLWNLQISPAPNPSVPPLSPPAWMVSLRVSLRVSVPLWAPPSARQSLMHHW